MTKTEIEFATAVAIATGALIKDTIPGARTQTFPGVDLRTQTAGLVIRLPDGSEYRVTVVRSR